MQGDCKLYWCRLFIGDARLWCRVHHFASVRHVCWPQPQLPDVEGGSQLSSTGY
jgi:hypothetical protein